MVTMITLAIASVILGLSLELTSSTYRNANRDLVLQQSQALADGCVEVAFAQWKRYLDKNLNYNLTNVPTGNDLAFIQTNSPDQQATMQAYFANGNFALNRNTYKVVALGYDSNKNSLVLTDGAKKPDVISQTAANSLVPAKTYRYLATAEVTGQAQGGPVTAKVSRYFELVASDLVQKAIFFENDLEIFPGATMNITGDVHTNANLYAGYNTLSFYENVTAVGDYSNAFKPGDGKHSGTPESPKWSGTGGQSAQLTTQVARQEVLGAAPSTITDDIHKLIEVPGAGTDPDALARRRLFNTSDYQILINSSNVAITSNVAGVNVTIPAKSVKVTATNNGQQTTANALSSTVTVADTSIKDGRQAGNVLLNTIDVGALSAKIQQMDNTQPDGGKQRVVYTADLAYSDNSQTAIRLKNGATLAQDLSIASQNAVYINGDYNTGKLPPSNLPTAQPPTTQDVLSNDAAYNSFTEGNGYDRFSAMVAADAVTVLSNGWIDANSSSGTRIATPTTVNSAILSGNVPTVPGTYSGGVENFPRFLENWSNVAFTYYGSFIQLFASKQFTAAWGGTTYYQAPIRRWFFEMHFLTNPAPGFAKVTTKQRGAWFRESPAASKL